MITREADYAIRVVLFLSQNENKSIVSTADLAEEMEIPYRFLRKIVRRMVDADLLVSQRGQGGGLRLARNKKGISLADVFSAIDPTGIKMNLCLVSAEECTRSKCCPIHRALCKVQRELDEKLRQITFDTLVED